MTGIEATITLSPVLSTALIIVGVIGLVIIVSGMLANDAVLAVIVGTFLAICGFGGQHLLVDNMRHSAQDAIESRYDVDVLGDIDWSTLEQNGTLPLTVKPAGDTTITPATLAFDGDRLTLFTTGDEPTQWGTPTS